MASSIVEAFSLSHAQILDGATPFLSAATAPTVSENLDVYGVNSGSLSPSTSEWNNTGDDQVLSTWSWLEFAEVEVQAGYLSFPLIANLTGSAVASGAAAAAVNEVQTVGVGAATAGSFVLTFEGQTTAAIVFNATATAVQNALLALDNIDTTDVVVTGSAPTWTITFGGKYAGLNVSALTGVGTGLTGGALTITQTTQGSGPTADTYSVDLWHEDSMNVAPRPMILRMPSKDHDGVVRSLTIGLFRAQFKPITFNGPSYKEGMKINYGARALMSRVDELGNPFSDGKKRVGRLISH